MNSPKSPSSRSFPPGTRLLALALVPLSDPAAPSLGASGVGDRKPVERASRTPKTLDELAPQVDAPSDLHLLLVPADEAEQATWGHDLRETLNERFAAPGMPCTVLQVPGAVLAHTQRALAVCAEHERMEPIARAALEGACIEHELRELEVAIEQGWGPMKQAAPLAFEFDERSLVRRSELSAHFVALVELRSRLARLSPRILAPQVYPPTLASQVSERLRERLRLAERLEAASSRLEAQERVFEMCGQRLTEVALASRGHALEWIIIVLLSAQTVLWIVEMLGSGDLG
jgi:hypothetical protein